MQRSPRPGRAPAQAAPRLRVVIADDHRILVDALRSALTRRGLDVVGVALDGTAAARPDVAILDVLMPKVGGLDAARDAITRAPDTAVVLITGGGDLGFVLEGMAIGVRGFVVKSAAIEELQAAIKAVSRGAT